MKISRPKSAGSAIISDSNGEISSLSMKIKRASSEEFNSSIPPFLNLSSKSWVETTSDKRWRVYDPTLFDIMGVSPKILAKQMAIVDLEYFKQIEKKEFISLEWSGPDAKIKSPSISKSIRRFNNLTLWFANQILQSHNVKRRAEKVDHFIEIAKYCSDYHNFNGLKCILASLQSAPIYRLNKTWELVEKKKTYDSLSNLMSSDSNSEKYRKRIASVKGDPCVPYLGQCLTDITFHFEMKGKNKIEGSNFEQYVDELLKMQQQSYDFQKIPEATEFLSSDFFITEFERQYEDENYNQSLRLEPKEQTNSSSPLFNQNNISSSSSSSIQSVNNSNNTNKESGSGAINHMMPPVRQSSSNRLPSLRDIVLENSEKKQRPLSRCLIQSSDEESDGASTEEDSNQNIQVREKVLEESSALLKSELFVKCLTKDFKKAKNRKWNKYLVVLRKTGIMLYKTYNATTLETYTSPLIILDICEETFVASATDYKKRKNVLRVSPMKGFEYFIECKSEDDLSKWISTVSFYAEQCKEGKPLISLS